jgi:hypothetical protein
MSASNPTLIVTEVVRLEDLPPGSRGTRRAIARWSDGTESEALTWYADEILICEGDLIGKPASNCAPCTSAETAIGSSHRRPRRELVDASGRQHALGSSTGVDARVAVLACERLLFGCMVARWGLASKKEGAGW